MLFFLFFFFFFNDTATTEIYTLSLHDALPISPYAGSSQPCTGPQGVACYPLLDGNGIHLPGAVANYRSPASVTNNQDDITQEFRFQSNDPNARIVWTVGG